VLLFWITITRVIALLFIGLWFVMQFFSGVASLGIETAQTGGVAYWAHIGGFLLGVIVGFLFRGRAPQLEREPSRSRNEPF
jgi:membrane associated rhomboid family serine protease